MYTSVILECLQTLLTGAFLLSLSTRAPFRKPFSSLALAINIQVEFLALFNFLETQINIYHAIIII